MFLPLASLWGSSRPRGDVTSTVAHLAKRRKTKTRRSRVARPGFFAWCCTKECRGFDEFPHRIILLVASSLSPPCPILLVPSKRCVTGRARFFPPRRDSRTRISSSFSHLPSPLCLPAVRRPKIGAERCLKPRGRVARDLGGWGREGRLESMKNNTCPLAGCQDRKRGSIYA